jgi:hypothetical protein
MGKSATNISIILGVITIVFAGYYFYSQNSSVEPRFETNEQTMQNMLNNTKAFIGYRAVLRDVQLDYSFFEDERLLSLKSFTTPINDEPIGRSNPFADVAGRETE